MTPSPSTQSNGFKEFLLEYKEPIALLLSIGSSVWLFITNLKVSHSFKEFSANVSSFLTFVEFLNVCVLILAILMLVRKYILTVKDENNGTPKLISLEPDNWDPEKKAENVRWKIERVNKLVSQLVSSLQGFAVVLLFMYVLLSLTDLNQSRLNSKDKFGIKKEEFINAISEQLEPNSEYNQIVNIFEKKKQAKLDTLYSQFGLKPGIISPSDTLSAHLSLYIYPIKQRPLKKEFQSTIFRRY